MIEDIYFEKFPLNLGSSWQMTLIPPDHTKIKTADAKAAISVSGTQVGHRFSVSNQPLSASEVSAVRDIIRDAKQRPFLFKNPVHNSVSYPPLVTDLGTLMTGAFIRPAQSFYWQPVIVFASANLNNIALKPVVYVENAKLNFSSTVIDWNPVTKLSPDLQGINAGNSSTNMQFATFEYWLPVRITQFEVTPIKNTRGLNLSCVDSEYLASITLEEDVKCGLPVIYSWQRNDTPDIT